LYLTDFQLQVNSARLEQPSALVKNYKKRMFNIKNHIFTISHLSEEFICGSDVLWQVSMIVAVMISYGNWEVHLALLAQA
jgi:hypothetical protein